MATKAVGVACSADKEWVQISPVTRIETQYPVDAIHITAWLLVFVAYRHLLPGNLAPGCMSWLL